MISELQLASYCAVKKDEHPDTTAATPTGKSAIQRLEKRRLLLDYT